MIHSPIRKNRAVFIPDVRRRKRILLETVFLSVLVFPGIWIQNLPVHSTVELCIVSGCGVFMGERTELKNVSNFQGST